LPDFASLQQLPVETVQHLTSRHVVQTEHLNCLTQLLLEKGCAPGDSALLEGSRRRDDHTSDDEGESEEEENDEDDEPGRERQKMRARVRERIMEEWQKLALVTSQDLEMNVEWFEDVCEVEVGRWEER
jgi:hypothetical protein